MRWTENTQKQLLFYLVLFLIGLAFIVRPTNVFVVLLLPFMFKNLSVFKEQIINLILKNTHQLFVGLFFLMLPILFLIYHNYLMFGSLAVLLLTHTHKKLSQT
jgi:hypothetical protein